MELWTSKHAPESVEEILDEKARELLRNVSGGDLNAVIYGPKGSGKTAAVRALAAEEFGDAAGSDLFVLNASDFFGMTKSEIASDPRFRSFISSKRERQSSKADLMNHVLKEVASHPTVENDYKIMLIDNAGNMRRDFQQALRRVMERYSSTCQFVLTTRSHSSLIPAIRSRCFPVPFRAPSKESISERLSEIGDAERVEYEDEGIEFIAEDSEGDLRKAIMTFQTVAETREKVTMDSVFEVLEDVGENDVGEMIDEARDGNFDDAVDILDDLLIDQGYSGVELLERVVEESKKLDDEEGAHIVREVGDVEADLSEGANDRIHLERLLSSISSA